MRLDVRTNFRNVIDFIRLERDGRLHLGDSIPSDGRGIDMAVYQLPATVFMTRDKLGSCGLIGPMAEKLAALVRYAAGDFTADSKNPDVDGRVFSQLDQFYQTRILRYELQVGLINHAELEDLEALTSLLE